MRCTLRSHRRCNEPGDTTGVLHVRAWYEDQTYVFELQADEACFLPVGSHHEYRNFSGSDATATLGVAPTFTPENEL